MLWISNLGGIESGRQSQRSKKENDILKKDQEASTKATYNGAKS